MYTSDRKENRKKLSHILFIYLGVTAFCAFFSIVYESFSHGVYSPFMVYMFAFPMIGGILPSVLMLVFNARLLPRPVQNAWNSGVATLTVGSCLSGIFEIYGTFVDMVSIYWYVGSVLCIAALIGGVICAFKAQKQKVSPN